MTGNRADMYSDFRRVLDRKDIDAVVVATPDHWHALMDVLACRPGRMCTSKSRSPTMCAKAA